jgi:hypothetical protein
MEFVLHIGASKCGSSALQTALTQTPRMTAAGGRRIEYVAIRPDGTVATGKRLKQIAAKGKHGYVPSVVERVPTNRLRHVRDEFSGLQADVVILSDENWLRHPELIRNRLLPVLPGDCRAVLYVRPQVEWMNSAWWQWGFWESTTLKEWITSNIDRILWANLVNNFIIRSGIQDVRVRLLPKEIISDFFGMHDILLNYSTDTSVNRGLPGSVLKFLKRHREELRPGPHASGIDFVLSRHLDIGSGSPWILAEEDVQLILDRCRDDNQRLLGLLDQISAQTMMDDPRWWHREAFVLRTRDATDFSEIDVREMEELCLSMTRAIVKLDAALRHCKIAAEA